MGSKRFWWGQAGTTWFFNDDDKALHRRVALPRRGQGFRLLETGDWWADEHPAWYVVFGDDPTFHLDLEMQGMWPGTTDEQAQKSNDDALNMAGLMLEKRVLASESA